MTFDKNVFYRNISSKKIDSGFGSILIIHYIDLSDSKYNNNRDHLTFYVIVVLGIWLLCTFVGIYKEKVIK